MLEYITPSKFQYITPSKFQQTNLNHALFGQFVLKCKYVEIMLVFTHGISSNISHLIQQNSTPPSALT
jgi:hypothetical protein